MIKEFITKDEIIVPAVTKEQLCELDRIAAGEIASYLFQVVEKTGKNLVLIIIGIISEPLYQILL